VAIGSPPDIRQSAAVFQAVARMATHLADILLQVSSSMGGALGTRACSGRRPTGKVVAVGDIHIRASEFAAHCGQFAALCCHVNSFRAQLWLVAHAPRMVHLWCAFMKFRSVNYNFNDIQNCSLVALSHTPLAACTAVARDFSRHET
jgi:hypothetical protein